MSMSDQDQPQAPGREQTRDDARQQAERGAGAAGGAEGRGGRHGGGGRRRHGRPSTPQQQGQGSRRPESSLNMDELRELTELFTAHGLTDFEFENADIRVRLSRNPAPQAGATPAQAAPASVAPAPTPPVSSGSSTAGATQPAASSTAESSPATPSAEELHIITSPIVGTFYRSPSPNDEPFIKAGSHVEQDTVVCIIEAMKLMNEIQAETSGVVEKIYVENGQPVEFGQPLFGVKK
ncbi:MAG TPA: acetyl-CoA carboxylase biotin carboxyl carrier protein [Pyrinomonadaceae bacterium]|jgi:acetyl-CoA carboxylase biotin carboxyl carrier protein|nr:acetyl-CoA carboxylase biotin carboxyl carrier protein [Pyrinomonadaceae bacterium]